MFDRLCRDIHDDYLADERIPCQLVTVVGGKGKSVVNGKGSVALWLTKPHQGKNHAVRRHFSCLKDRIY